MEKVVTTLLRVMWVVASIFAAWFRMDQAITAVPTQARGVPDPSIILFGGKVIQLLMTATPDR